MVSDNKGFTLVEIMVVLAIMSILVVSLSGVLSTSRGLFQRVSNQSELQQNLRVALDIIVRDIQKSKSIGPESSSTEIILISLEGEKVRYGLKPDDMQDEHKFQLTGQVLFQEKNGGNREPIANFIDSLTFSYNHLPPEKATYVAVKIKGKIPGEKEIVLKSGAGLKWLSFGVKTN